MNFFSEALTMKAGVPSKYVTAFVCGLVIAVCATSRAVTVTASLTPPTTDANDRFYFPGNTDDINNIGGIDTSVASGDNDESTYVAFDRSSKGMTFTTGPGATGYTLSSISIQHVLWNNFLANGTYYDLDTNDTFEFQFGSISGTTKTIRLDTNAAVYTGPNIPAAGVGGDSGTGNFFTFALSPGDQAIVGTLAANSTFYFEIAPELGGQFFELNGTKADGFAGGQAYRGSDLVADDGTIGTTVVTMDGDFAFHADLVPGAAPLACDVNGIGGCNSADFAIIRDHLLTAGNRAQGDLTGDGFVDYADYRLFKDDPQRVVGFGAGSGEGAFASEGGVGAIPEPASLLQLGIVSLLLCGRCASSIHRRKAA